MPETLAQQHWIVVKRYYRPRPGSQVEPDQQYIDCDDAWQNAARLVVKASSVGEKAIRFLFQREPGPGRSLLAA